MREGKSITRRRVLTIIGLGGAAVVTILGPSKWTRPVVESIVVPAHAAASPIRTTQPPPSTEPPSSTTGIPPVTLEPV